MAIDWLKNFFIPLIQIAFIGGIVLYGGFFVVRGFMNAWKKSVKYFFRYKVMRKPYPDKYVKWILDCIERRIGWYEAKRMLLIKMLPDKEINEILWIYDQMLKVIGKNEKGGINSEYGRGLKKCNSKDEGKPTEEELPTFQ